MWGLRTYSLLNMNIKAKFELSRPTRRLGFTSTSWLFAKWLSLLVCIIKLTFVTSAIMISYVITNNLMQRCTCVIRRSWCSLAIQLLGVRSTSYQGRWLRSLFTHRLLAYVALYRCSDLRLSELHKTTNHNHSFGTDQCWCGRCHITYSNCGRYTNADRPMSYTKLPCSK